MNEGTDLSMHGLRRRVAILFLLGDVFPNNILHRATPAEPQPGGPAQPVPVSGDHHIADENKMLHLLPSSLFRNTPIPERALVTVLSLLAAFPPQLGIQLCCRFYFLPRALLKRILLFECFKHVAIKPPSTPLTSGPSGVWEGPKAEGQAPVRAADP